jgi:glucose 1-dehydrogenase
VFESNAAKPALLAWVNRRLSIGDYRTVSLHGKVALVTGAARGIGQAIAIELASRGSAVVVCDVLDAGDTLAAIKAHGTSALSLRTDVGNRHSVEQAFAAIEAEFGCLDILVNNAVRSIRKPLVDLTVEDVEQTLAVALWGVFHCSQLAARMMIAGRRPGNIVMISSVLAHIPYATSSSYNGAKAAVNQMARTWALELAPQGIRVNILEPGWVDTPGERSFATDAQLQTEGGKLPLGRLGRPGEIAKAVAFLVSEEASYITGSTLRVDGGISLIR